MMKKYILVLIGFMALVLFINLSFAVITLNNIIDSPDPITINNTIILDCDAFDGNGTIDTVLIEIDPPGYPAQNFSMDNITNTTFRYSYSPNETGTFIYRIYANNSDGTWEQSNLYSFLSVPVGYDPFENMSTNYTDVSITIEISASCDGGITFYYAPDFVIRGQHVVFVTLAQNVGNLAQNETTTVEIKDSNGTGIGNYIPLMGQTQTAPGTLVFDTVASDPADYRFEFGIWDSLNYSVGDYSVTAILNWVSLFSSGNVTETWSQLNTTSNCTNTTYSNVTWLNTTTCYKTIYDRCQYYEIGNSIDALMISNTTKNVTYIEENTTGKYGNATFGGSEYNIYLFNVSNCTDYCYACLSRDEIINESSECGISGENIQTDSGLYSIDDINSQGLWANFTQLIESCSFLGEIYNCSLDLNNNTAYCNKTLECNGQVVNSRSFQIVETYGNESGNETEPEPVPTPTPTPEPQPQPEDNPTPTPTPSPEPEPSPGSNESTGQTQIAINIEPLDRDVIGEQGEWIPLKFNVSNIGDVNVTNVNIIPIVMDGWEVKIANVSFIDVNETLNRTIFVRPPFDTVLAKYVIPVKAIRGNLTLDMDYAWLTVTEAGNRTRIEILEAPGSMGIIIDTVVEAPILLKNTGKIPLHNIKAELQNAERCIINFDYMKTEALGVNETVSITLTMKSGVEVLDCDSTLIISSDEGAYAFADIFIRTSPGAGLLPDMPMVMFFLITLIIVLSVLTKIKKGREAQEMEPGAIGTVANILMFLLILIVIYLILGYLEFVPIF